MATKRTRLRAGFVLAIVLTGCSALIDVKDIYFDPEGPVVGGPDGSGGDGGGGDGGVDPDADTSCVADLQTDPLHCGRCNHDCLGGACEQGRCTAVQIAAISGAPLRYLVASDAHVFVSTRIELVNQAGGIWRIPKAGGAAEHYVTLRYPEGMAILGDTLYFAVRDDANDGVNETGGLYSCPVAGPSPCEPTLIAPADNPRGATVDRGKVYYPDETDGQGIMVHAPPATPTLFRPGFGHALNLKVDGEQAFYTVSFFNGPARATLFEVLPDAGFVEISRYENANASTGRLVMTPEALYVSMYDYDNATTSGGVVRRVPRTDGVLPCDYGGTGNKRPFGLHVDASRIYWTNQGEGRLPYTNGSVVSCDLATCCTAPEILWTGDGPGEMTGDERALYWAHQATGAVWKIAKP
jgi:hypothetical protein